MCFDVGFIIRELGVYLDFFGLFEGVGLVEVRYVVTGVSIRGIVGEF